LRGRDIHPGSIDWSRVDVRKYYFYQPPGGSNALGQVKFLFPNKHDVYLHDTPNKGLFGSQVRAFSHGCIRVRQPLKLAEALLREDQGWTSDRVTMTVRHGPQDNQINLQGSIPVHLTYFTVLVDDDGRVRTFPDVYKHEHRIAYGLAGKPHLIKREPESSPQKVQARRSPRSWIASPESAERPSRSTDVLGGSSGADLEWARRVFRD
jgi:murein L,D-transpeptidase YcbB/YkuD